MKLKGATLAFLQCDPARQKEFNLWYDTDHVPENWAIPGIFLNRRYVAPPAYVKARDACTIGEGAGNYVTMYLSERDVIETRREISALGERLRAQGRFVDCFNTVYRCLIVPEKTVLRESCSLAPEAAILIPHKGLYVTIDDATNTADYSALVRWYDEVYTLELLKSPGFVAALRFRSVSRGQENYVVHCFLLEGDPISLVETRRKVMAELGSEGKELPSSVQHVFAGPYLAIQPMQYDFLPCRLPHSDP